MCRLAVLQLTLRDCSLLLCSHPLLSLPLPFTYTTHRPVSVKSCNYGKSSFQQNTNHAKTSSSTSPFLSRSVGSAHTWLTDSMVRSPSALGIWSVPGTAVTCWTGLNVILSHCVSAALYGLAKTYLGEREVCRSVRVGMLHPAQHKKLWALPSFCIL